MTVRRYHANRDGGMCESGLGSYVCIEDYQYLEAKIALLEAGERARQVEETRRAIERATEAERRSACQQAPIARMTVAEWGVAGITLYAPGLPPGEHDLYCEPAAVAPYLRAGDSK